MLILERPWTRQPQLAVQGASSGIGAGLVAYGTGAVNNGWAPVNSPTSVITNYGRALTFSSASSQYLTKPTLPLSSTLTLFALVMPSSMATNSVILNVGSLSVVNANLLYWNTSSTVLFYNGEPGNYGQAGGGSLAINVWYSLVARKQSSASRQVFINGVQVGTNTDSSLVRNNDIIHVGVQNFGGSLSGYLNGKLAIWGVWNRALTDGEIMSLYVNPWQLFAPQQIIIPTPAAAASAPTITALSAIGITTTSAQPRITYA